LMTVPDIIRLMKPEYLDISSRPPDGF